MQTITYYMTVDDYVAFGLHQFFTKNPSPQPRTVRALKGSFPLIILGLPAYYMYSLGQMIPFWGLSILALLALYTLWHTTFKYEQYIESSIKKQVLHIYQNGNDDRLKYPHTIIIDGNGVECQLSGKKYTFDWKAITGTYSTSTYIFLYYSQFEAIIVPRTAFSNNNEFEIFIQSIHNYMQTST